MGVDASPPAAREDARPPGAPPAEVVGREVELEALAGLCRDGGGPSALLLEGEPGIGKTTLWQVGLERARTCSERVLVCRPAEAEATLPFSALADLLEPVLGTALPLLPEPQRVALEVALQRAAPADGPADRLAVSRAALAILHGSEGATTTVAVDDVQWLDAPSAEVIEFAARRLGDARVLLLLSRRGGPGDPLPLGLGTTFPVQRLHVGPLSVDELGRLIAHRQGHLSRPLLVELHRTSGGNPYFALEVVRALEGREGTLEAGAALPVPDSIGGLLRSRIGALSPAAGDVLVVAAASSQPSASLLEMVTGTTEGLAEALDAGILERNGDRLRFTHPLLASVAYGAASSERRREAHRRLAAAKLDRQERARHLALGTVAPDAGVSAELDAAAELAARRGAPSSAGELSEQAARLTPAESPGDRRQRLTAAAAHFYSAGDYARSRSILDGLAAELPAGPERARVLVQLSRAFESQLETLELCRQALREAGDDHALTAEIHLQCAGGARRATTLPEAADHARLAIEAAVRAGDGVRGTRALAMLGHVELMTGRRRGLRALERAAEEESPSGDFPLPFRPGFLLGLALLYVGEFDGARPLIQAQLERASDLGDEVMRGIALSSLAELELRAGNWSHAYRFASDGASLQEQAAPLQDQAHHVLRAARVMAHLGRVDEARAVAERLLELAPRHEDKLAEVTARRDLGFIELSVGNPAATVALLEPAIRLLDAMGHRLPSAYPFLQDHVEALVALGDLGGAERANVSLARSAYPWEAAMHARGRALIAAARGDGAAAREAIGSALQAHERLREPFELGRTLLVQGSIERRANRRAAARQALTRALDLFDSLGAPLWAEKAAAELARIPGRTPSTGELSESERRVAELVADGLSNREVAARLFVTVRTVEAHLSKVYAKLGVRSRMELAGRFGPRPDA